MIKETFDYQPKGETELDTPEVDTSSHFGNTRSKCIKQYPELGTPDLSTPELDTT